MSSGARDSGAAVRRRQRRLRAQLRHEQQSVAMAVAAALHHSANKKSPVVEGTHSARQGQKTAAGTRPAPLAEVAEPQGLSVAPRCPDAGVPLLSVPLLAGRGGIDDNSVRWLLKVELRKRQKEEKERKEEEEWAESRRRRSLSSKEEEEEEEEEEDSKKLFLSWPRSSSTAAVAHSLCWFSW